MLNLVCHSEPEILKQRIGQGKDPKGKIKRKRKLLKKVVETAKRLDKRFTGWRK